jgi:hemerythrin-like metal-binding protein
LTPRYETHPITWNESFSVGVDLMDQHHQQLASLINRLAERTSEDLNSEPMVDILGALVRYAEYHFRQEEELMATANYQELETHRQEHLQFCEIISETCYGASLGIVGARELFSYLTRWWRNHILHEDMKYKPLLSALPEHLRRGAA